MIHDALLVAAVGLASVDGVGPTSFVASWEEHLRQHERVSRRAQERLREITEMTEPSAPPTVTHWLAPPAHRP